MHFPKHDLDKRLVAAALVNPDTTATVLHVLALNYYNDEIYTFDAVEVILRLEEDFRCKIPEANENKLKAILLATATDIFYEYPKPFAHICNTLCEGDPEIDDDDDLTLPEVLWGIYEVELNHGTHTFDPAVQRIIDREVEGVADDPETSGDPYEHAYAYLQDRRDDLVRQLDALGYPESILKEVPPAPVPERKAAA